MYIIPRICSCYNYLPILVISAAISSSLLSLSNAISYSLWVYLAIAVASFSWTELHYCWIKSLLVWSYWIVLLLVSNWDVSYSMAAFRLSSWLCTLRRSNSSYFFSASHCATHWLSSLIRFSDDASFMLMAFVYSVISCMLLACY